MINDDPNSENGLGKEPENNKKNHQSENNNSYDSSYVFKGGIHTKNTFIGPYSPIDEAHKLKDLIHEFVPSIDIPISRINIGDEVEKLNNKRILILDSPVFNLLLGTVNKLVNHDKLKKLSKKILNFNRGDKTNPNLLFESLFYEVFEKEQDVCLVHFTNNKIACSNFFNQLLETDFIAGVGEYQSILKSKNSYVIITVSEQEYIKKLNSSGIDEFIGRKHISYIENSLFKFFDETEAAQLFEMIKQQRNNGKWPQADDDFNKTMQICFSDSPEVARKIILDKDKSNISVTYQNIFTKETEHVNKLVTDDDKLIRYVLYVAANFIDLSLNEFDHVVRILLSDTKKTEVIPNPLKEEEKIESQLLSRWERDSDLIMKKLQLKEVFSQKEESRIVVFGGSSGFREMFNEEFFSTWALFCQQQFNYLFFVKGVMFNPETPDRVLDNIIRMAAEVATNDPELYCKRLLLYTTLSIVNQKAKIDLKFDENEEDFQEVFEDLLNQIEQKHFELELQKLEGLSKIGLLLASMHGYENLKYKIDEYFNLLISLKLHDAVYYFVRFLRKTPGFDVFKWIQQLFDRAPNRIGKEVYSFWVRLLQEDSGTKAMQTFQILRGMQKGKSHKGSNSYNAGLCILIHYLFSTVESLNPEEYGEFPSKHHLLSLSTNQKDIHEILDFLLDWLLDYELNEAYTVLNSFFEKNMEYNFNEDTLPHLLTQLMTVLMGIKKVSKISEKDNPSIQISIKMMELLGSKVQKVQRKELRIGFQKWKDRYYDLMKSENVTFFKYKDLFGARSRTAGTLYNYLNNQNKI